MLVNTELLAALNAAGVDDEKAGAAAAILADYERRLRRIERLFEISKWGAAICGALLIFFIILFLDNSTPFQKLANCD
jgi:hypothetical protein